MVVPGCRVCHRYADAPVFLVLDFSLVCKIRSGASELFKPVNITVEVQETRAEGRYSIEGKAEMPGFTFVVMFVLVMCLCNLLKQTDTILF